MVSHHERKKSVLFARFLLTGLTFSTPILNPSTVLWAAVDPFYSRLLERGSRDLESGRAAEAEIKLRTACFGLLDEPTLLAEGLVQLARARAITGDTAGLRKTLDRLAEIEEQFGAYSSLEKAALRTAFEKLLQGSIPQAELDATRLFVPPAEVAEQPRPEALLSPRRQRKALEQRLASNPDDREALWKLAQLELSEAKPKRAAARLDRLLATQPDDGAALCLRAEIAVTRKECEPILAAHGSCPSLTGEGATTAFVLECLMSASEPPSTSGVDSTAGPMPEMRLPLDNRIRRLRSDVAAAQVRSDLAEPMTRAAELADEYPDSAAAQHLVAEIAFRSADYPLAVKYLWRGGRPSSDQHVLLFFLAVSMFETQNYEGAERALREALPRLEASEPSDYVRSYIDKILGHPRRDLFP